jgi:hypothetical protein
MNNSVVAGWVWDHNVRPLLDLLSHYAGYPFDDTDWQAVALGLEATDDDHQGLWYSYPLQGHHQLTIRLANAVGSSVVSVRIEGLDDRDLALRAATLLDAYAHYGSP